MTQNYEHARTQRDEAQQARDHAEASLLKLQKERLEMDQELHELATKDSKSPEDHKRKRTLDTQKLDVQATEKEARKELEGKEKSLHQAESHLQVAELAQEADGLVGATRQDVDTFTEQLASELDDFCKAKLEAAQEHDRKVNSIITRVNSQPGTPQRLRTNGDTLMMDTEEGTVSYSANAQFLVKKTIEETSRRFEAVQQQAAREQARQLEEAKRQAEEDRQKAHQEWLQSPEGQLEQARLASKYQWEDRKEPGMQVSDLKGVGAQ